MTHSSLSPSQPIRVGVIGLDISHSVVFTRMLNDPGHKEHVPGCRVTVAYPQGSRDIESSVSRIPQYTEQIQEQGVEIASSIEELLEQVDAVLLETNDGRVHLEQARQVIRAGKPMYVDKPLAGSLADVVLLFREARTAGVPVYASSSLRYMPSAQQARNGALGEVIGCDTYSPASLEATHPDLFWYGIHGVETLFTVMGTGCEEVVRMSTPGTDLVVGRWEGGRVGTFRGLRPTRGYGGMVFGSKDVRPLGPYEGYQPLVQEIARFFQTGESPVPVRETVEIYAFMEAADESKRQDGIPVKLDHVLRQAGYAG